MSTPSPSPATGPWFSLVETRGQWQYEEEDVIMVLTGIMKSYCHHSVNIEAIFTQSIVVLHQSIIDAEGERPKIK